MIIGLSGVAQSGKDSVVKILVEKHGYQRRAFADLLRAAALAIDPIVGPSFSGDTHRLSHLVTIDGWEQAKTHSEVRRLLQVLGTEMGRSLFGESFWVDQVTKDLQGKELIAFSDCRFKNEAQKIKDLGGQVWRVERPGVEAVNSHPSEHDLDGWYFDRVIENSGDLGHLEEMVQHLLQLNPTDPRLQGMHVIPKRGAVIGRTYPPAGGAPPPLGPQFLGELTLSTELAEKLSAIVHAHELKYHAD